MKKGMIPLLLVFVCVFADAQPGEIAVASVRYNFTHMRDTTLPEELYKENMILYIGKHTSNYVSYDRILYNKHSMENPINVNDIKSMDVNNGVATITSFSGSTITLGNLGTANSIFKNITDGKLANLEVFRGVTYIVEEPTPSISWQISDETKIIEGLSCQKATGDFRGRSYEAWFCSQLPYNNGPWKLGGLPGLIVEAYDTKKQVVFLFAGYEDITAEQKPLSIVSSAIKTTAKDLTQLKDAFAKDPAASKSAADAGGLRGDVVVKGASSFNANPNTNSVKRKVMNNPIELTN